MEDLKLPVVSIIIPCYNQGQFLGEALTSVSNQTFSEWECIIVDDGSQDDTKQIATGWTRKDHRVKYYYKENGGLSSARNYGMAKARGSYLQFLDSDDYIASNKLQVSITAFKSITKHEEGLVVTNFRIFQDDVLSSTEPYCELNESCFNLNFILLNWNEISIPIHCGLISREQLGTFQFPEELKALEDWVMWLHLFHQKPQVVFIDEPMAFYRRHLSSMTTKVSFIDENHIKAILYTKDIIPDKDFVYSTILKHKEDAMRIRVLESSIANYKKTRIYRISKWFKSTYLGKLLLIYFRK